MGRQRPVKLSTEIPCRHSTAVLKEKGYFVELIAQQDQIGYFKSSVIEMIHSWSQCNLEIIRFTSFLFGLSKKQFRRPC